MPTKNVTSITNIRFTLLFFYTYFTRLWTVCCFSLIHMDYLKLKKKKQHFLTFHIFRNLKQHLSKNYSDEIIKRNKRKSQLNPESLLIFKLRI